jgi:hypothetical protein
VGAETDWQLHARWQLGEVSDADYADALVRGGVADDDVIVRMLRERDRPARGDSGTSDASGTTGRPAPNGGD